MASRNERFSEHNVQNTDDHVLDANCARGEKDNSDNKWQAKAEAGNIELPSFSPSPRPSLAPRTREKSSARWFFGLVCERDCAAKRADGQPRWKSSARRSATKTVCTETANEGLTLQVRPKKPPEQRCVVQIILPLRLEVSLVKNLTSSSTCAGNR